MNIKKFFRFAAIILWLGSAAVMKGEVKLLVANDLGRNGAYEQKTIAATMGKVAEEMGPDAVLAIGDTFHYMGIQSVNDPLWYTNFELIYNHPELQVPWHPVLGNHEYRGNSQAVLDYSNISRRWEMPARYYTKVYDDNDTDTSVRIVFLDTAPIIDKYRKDKEQYPDVCKQDMEKQLAWLDSVLENAKEDWVIVVGHHPIHAETSKSSSERSDLQKRIVPILKKHKVKLAIGGHVHNFQHIRVDGINYVVNSSGSQSRKVKTLPETLYCSSEPGFSTIEAGKNNLEYKMLDKTGKVIYSFTLSGK